MPRASRCLANSPRPLRMRSISRWRRSRRVAKPACVGWGGQRPISTRSCNLQRTSLPMRGGHPRSSAAFAPWRRDGRPNKRCFPSTTSSAKRCCSSGTRWNHVAWPSRTCPRSVSKRCLQIVHSCSGSSSILLSRRPGNGASRKRQAQHQHPHRRARSRDRALPGRGQWSRYQATARHPPL